MNKIKLLRQLIADAEKEIRYIKEYLKKEGLDIKKELPLGCFWKMRTPSKQRIKDDLKMIRRISLEIEGDLNNEQ